MATTRFDYKHNNLMKSGFILIITIAFMIAGCNKESSENNLSSYASVSAYAVVPDAPELNFFMNGLNIATGVPYGSYTLYNRISPGTFAFRLQSYSRNITADTSFNTTENNYYSLFITGSETSVKPVLLRDTFPKPDSGYSRIRFFVFAPGVSNIDLHLVKDSAKGINKIIGWSGRSYGNDMSLDSVNTFKKFAAGTYYFYAISNADITDTLAKLGSKTFTDSTNYTLMLLGHLTSVDTSLYLGSRLH